VKSELKLGKQRLRGSGGGDVFGNNKPVYKVNIGLIKEFNNST